MTDTCDLEVAIDAGQIQQALLNLVMNAVDASPEHAPVWLRAQLEGECVQIEIENSGKAIPERDLSRIFEPFFSTKPNGSGLGLAIARNIARAHGGDLVISANEPGRVCFAMTLPLAPSPKIEVKKERWAVS